MIEEVTPVESADAAVAVSAGPKPSRRWLGYVVVAGASLVLGAVVATSVLLFSGWRYAPVNEYRITVTMKRDATAQQKDAARAVLAKLPSEKGVTTENRDEAFARMVKDFEDVGYPMPDGLSAEDMPEALKVSTKDRDFDCTAVSALHDNAGVDRFIVGMVDGATGRGAALGC
nr:permease-like cell division protein FtsX [uncultured Actinoplanes sp.]